MVVASLLLEKLREMVLAVEDPLQGCIVGWCDGTATMGALEAGLVVGLFFNCHLQCFIKKSIACFGQLRTAISKIFRQRQGKLDESRQRLNVLPKWRNLGSQCNLADNITKRQFSVVHVIRTGC